MAWPPDHRDLTRLLRTLRHEIAQNRTDIQRLWRLVSRDVHEPFFVIGGDVEESSSSGSDASGTIGPPPDNTDPPQGGPDPGQAIADGCCLWVWDGQQWILALDRSDSCGCPTPEAPGTFLFQQAVTCCEESSSASSSSGSPCGVACWECALPCTLTHSMSLSPGQSPTPQCDDFAGSRQCVWSESTQSWQSDCFSLPNGGVHQTGRISIAVKTTAVGQCVLVVTHRVYVEAACAGASAIADSFEVEIESCDPLFGETSAGCSGTYTVSITE